MRNRSGTMAMALMGALVWSASARAEDCEKRFTSSEVSGTLLTAEAAFSQLEEETFERQMVSAAAMLTCVSEPLPVLVVSQYHRMVGIREFLARDQDEASAAFASARVLEPSYSFPETLLPADHPIRSLYASAQARATPVDPPPAPEKGQLYFDGTPTTQRPAGRSTIFQVVEKQGPSLSAYLPPTSPLPDYPLKREDVAVAPRGNKANDKANDGSGRTLRLSLLGAGGASLIAAGAVDLLAYRAQSAFFDEGASNLAALEDLQAQANRRTLTATGLGVAGVGLIGAGLIVGSW